MESKKHYKRKLKLAFISTGLIFVAFFLVVIVDQDQNFELMEYQYHEERPEKLISESTYFENTPPVLTLTPRSIFADALLLVEVIEANHPIFILDGGSMLPVYYEERRAEFLEFAALATEREDFDWSCMINREKFELAAHRYISLLQDGHMSGNSLIRRQQNTSIVITEDWFVEDSRLFLVRDNVVSEIIAIGGAYIADIFYQVDRHFFAENEFDRQRNYVMHSRRRGILLKAGAQELTSNNIQMELTIEKDGQISITNTILQWGNPVLLDGKIRVPININNATLFHEIDDDIFYIKLRSSAIPHSYINDALAAIGMARYRGVTNFIIDVRNNEGGNSEIGRRLLIALSMTAPRNGRFLRAGPLSEHQTNMEVSSNTFSINPHNLSLVVLTSNYTYSAANMLAAWVQDGSLGTIIGEPSRNSPSQFGYWSIGAVLLPYSGFGTNVSQAWFSRPDISADQTTLWPDIIVESRYALDVAIDYLRNR